jgi:hypothetical protein
VEWLKKGLVVECLPSKCEALSLNLSTINKWMNEWLYTVVTLSFYRIPELIPPT